MGCEGVREGVSEMSCERERTGGEGGTGEGGRGEG